MKILILQDDFPPESLGGAGQVAFDLANVINCKYFLTSDQSTYLDGKSFLNLVYEGQGHKIYRNQHVMPRAFLTGGANTQPVQVVRYEPNRVELRAKVNASGHLVMSDVVYPGWKAYIDDLADLDKAVRVAVNAKTQRYGTCNTMETLLVAEGIAAEVLPVLAESTLLPGSADHGLWSVNVE